MTSSAPSDFAGRDRTALRKHLSSYWKMEAGNVLLMPGLGLLFLASQHDHADLAAGLGLAACAWLLVIGAAAWRQSLALLDDDTRLANRLIGFCARAEWPALALLVAATLALGAAVAGTSWHPRTAVALIGTVLGWLEYVNYYHWQLQNFDSVIDMNRLRAGRGLRRAHMGRAVRAWRRARRK
ncbi:MAG: hypothetical protein WCO82_05245 [Sphingomonadales bacterium]|jgi:hypothetical protein